MKRNKLLAVILLASTGFPGAVAAANLDYQYFDIAYTSFDVNGLDGDGFSLESSLELGAQGLMTFGYSNAHASDSTFRVTSDSFHIGFGGHSEISPSSDFVGEVGLVMDKTRGSFNTYWGRYSNDASDTGVFIELGFRSMVSDRVELSGGLSWINIHDESDTALGLGARFVLAPALSLLTGFTTADDFDSWIIGFRFEG